MIIVKIEGGLGNQMFQYAFAKALSIKKNITVKFDIGFYSDSQNKLSREYILPKFNINSPIATEKEINELQNKHSKFYNKLFRKIMPIFCSVYKEDNKVYDFKSHFLSSKVYVIGYWQNQKYFKNIQSQLCSDFSVKNTSEVNPELLNKIEGTNSVSIHFRRTDYCSIGLTIDANNTDYYSKSLEIIKSKVKNPELFIFSDDIEWVKKNMNFPFPATFVTEKDYIELFIMSKCKHNIIANSTFSWWAAWLNQYEKKIIIAPKTWHNKKANKSIYPKDWIKI
jgi:hypothetical protein